MVVQTVQRRLPLMGLAALALLLAGSGCGAGSPPESSVEASCAHVIDWKRSRYVAHTARLRVRPANVLGEATRLGCDDGHGASPDVEVAVSRIEGVEPAVAVGAPDDPWALYVREGHPLETAPIAPALERALYGPRCGSKEPFVLEGLLIGPSDQDTPFTVSVDVGRAEGNGRAYLGLPIALLVRDTTRGLSERDDFRPRVGEEWRLRATVTCVEGERPTRTFLAERLERVEERVPPPDLGRLHCPSDGPGPPCRDGAELGVSYPFDFYVHCGLRDAYFDGRWWALAGGPLEPGELQPGATAHGWARGLIKLLGEGEALFTGGGFRLGLVPAPDGYERAACD